MGPDDIFFTPEQIDEQIDRIGEQENTPEGRLLSDMQALYAADFVSDSEFSAAWQRIEQARKHVTGQTPVQEEQAPSLPIPAVSQGVVHMEFDNYPHDSQAVETHITPHRQATPARPRRSWIAVVAALLVVLLGAAVFALRPQHRPATPGANTHVTPTLVSIHTGKLLCDNSFSTIARPITFAQPPLDWSARGVIATGLPLKTFSAQTCAVQSLVNEPEDSLAQPIWSPDGKRLLVLHGFEAVVLDATTGKTLASFQLENYTQIGQAVWSSDGTQIVTEEYNILTHYTESVKVKLWDASSGSLVRTALTFNDGILNGSATLSPNGIYLATEGTDHKITFWNIATGNKVSTTSSSVTSSDSFAWSPDDAALAIGSGTANPSQPGEIQIWSSTTGQLTATFPVSNTFEEGIGGLAWSPDGRYLAEGSVEIHIWNVSTQKLVATFGKIASSGKSISRIVSVAWAPDSSKLASVTASATSFIAANEQVTLNVWQLS